MELPYKVFAINAGGLDATTLIITRTIIYLASNPEDEATRKMAIQWRRVHLILEVVEADAARIRDKFVASRDD